MRLSLSRTGTRLLRAGIAAATTAAVVLAGIATPALAAATLTVTPGGGSNSGTITATSSAFLNGTATPATIFSTTTCADPFTTATTNITATTTKSSDDTATITVPTTLALNSNAARTYNVCIYNGTSAGVSVLKGSGTYVMAPVATPTAASGPSGGGNTLTVNVPAASPVFSASSVPAAFASGGCPATYAGASITAAATKVTTTQVTVPVPVAVGGPDGTKFAVCFYAGTQAGSNGLIAASSATAYTVSLPAVTLSSTIGPASTTQDPVNLTITGPSTFLTGVTAPAVVVVAATASCTALYPGSPGSTMIAATRKVANNKAAFTMPTGPVVTPSAVSTDFKVCLYSSTSTSAGKLLSSSTFTVANQPTITAVLPSSGSALGNSTITVTGANFPTAANAITATLGGVALTSITSLNDSTFTAVTPAHAVGSVALTVTTALGTDTKPAAYTYANSIRISPNAAPSTTTAQDVDVQGSGFLGYAFSSNPASGAHVYLVDGVYSGITSSSIKANGPVADCGNVLVISDNELICSLNLTMALDPSGTLQPSGRRTATANTTSGSNLVTLATGFFNANDVGEPIVESGGSTNISSGTTILAVLNRSTAVMSANAGGTTSSPITVTIGLQSSPITAAGTQGNYTVAGNSGIFSQADIGRAVSGSNAVVVAVNDTGSTATLSVPNGGAVSSVTLTSGNPVPDGAYNLTVVSDVAGNAALTNPNYSQTIVSSESVFTVAPY